MPTHSFGPLKIYFSRENVQIPIHEKLAFKFSFRVILRSNITNDSRTFSLSNWLFFRTCKSRAVAKTYEMKAFPLHFSPCMFQKVVIPSKQGKYFPRLERSSTMVDVPCGKQLNSPKWAEHWAHSSSCEAAALSACLSCVSKNWRYLSCLCHNGSSAGSKHKPSLFSSYLMGRNLQFNPY